MLNNNEPLWLPRGSVRALMALIAVGVPMGRVALGLEVDEIGRIAMYGTMAAYSLLRVTDTPPGKGQ
jgi:hypothetical protein